MKSAVVVLLVGAVVAGAFSLHRIHPRTCYYRNWAAPCRTTGIRVDGTDLVAFGVALGAALAAGAIGGSWKQISSAARGNVPGIAARRRHVGDELRRHYREAPGNLAQSIFLAAMNSVMQRGTPRLEAEKKVVEDLRETYPDFTPLRQ